MRASTVSIGIDWLALPTLFITLAVFGFVRAWNASASPATVRLPPNLQIMPLGDSITDGAHGHHSGFRGPLGSLLSAVTTNFVFVGSSTENSRFLPPNERHHEGHPSFAVSDIYSNLDGFDDSLYRKYGGASRKPNGGHWLTGIPSGSHARPALYPNVILLMIGTNDRNHPKGAKARLDRLVSKIVTMRPKSHLIVARITPIARTLAYSNFVASYNRGVDAVAAKYAAHHLITEVDMNTGFPANGLSSDHMHPNDIGYRWMAARWYRAILAIYGQPVSQTEAKFHDSSHVGNQNSLTETAPTNTPPAFGTAAFNGLRTYLLPAVKRDGFRMDGYMLWSSSVIKVGDTYQMFASRWPAKYGMAGWKQYSECVRATSTNLFGPYHFQQVVLQKRPGHWDNSRVTNVRIVKTGPKYVLYYINTANETGYAVADSITGPWTRCNRPVIHASNPAPLVRPDLSVYVFCRLRDGAGVNRGIAFTAPSYQGRYTVLDHGDNLLPDGDELEDPAIWWANNQYNLLVNDWKSHATGIFKAGAQYYSKDGIHYHLVSRQPVFTKTVIYDDGTTETFRRRERPFVYVNKKGVALALFTACLPEHGASRVVAQPINRYYPGNP
jgi:GDSL-like Lipase/Acylhydrolase family